MFSYTPLFTLLLQKGLTKTQLREAVGIGTNTLAKLSKGENINTDVLERICKALNCEISDIVEIIKEDRKND